MLLEDAIADRESGGVQTSGMAGQSRLTPQ
jgi:hypothetical protein